MIRVQVVFGRVDPETNARTYTYSTSEDVAVGDVVLVPGNWLFKSAQEATVVELGSDYDGPADSVIRVVERA